MPGRNISHPDLDQNKNREKKEKKKPDCTGNSFLHATSKTFREGSFVSAIESILQKSILSIMHTSPRRKEIPTVFVSKVPAVSASVCHTKADNTPKWT